MKTPRKRRFGLSKSRITAFEQCPKKLWLSVHRPDLAEWDDAAEARFATGNAVGDVACSLHPDGVMVEAEPDLSAAIATTQQLLEEGHRGPIFEATFQHQGVLVRVDVLSRTRRGKGWHVAEVKSSAGPKDYHHADLATQIWVLRNKGLNVAGAAIRRVDRDFVLERESDYQGLLTDAELLHDLEPIIAKRAGVVRRAKAVLAGDEPEQETGDHCLKPFECEFAAYCNRNMPDGPEWPVTILPNGGGRKWANKGIANLLDLAEEDLSRIHARILVATRDDVPFHDVKAAREEMAQWRYPRAWLDFETIAPAVPRWIGTRPYQQVPFQFSLHLEHRNGRISHHEFLSCDGSDPRLSCAQALVEAIPADATIIAYNASFERGVLRDLAGSSRKHRKALLAMADNTVDLLPVARKHWYHRNQRGSWSIKAVLPTLSELDYGALEVKDGGQAQEAWLEAADPACDPERHFALEQGLRAYCERDTWAMVLVARALAGKRMPCRSDRF